MMIVIRASVPKELARSIKVKDVIVVDEDGVFRQLEVLSAYLDTKDQPTVALTKRRPSR